MNEEVYIGFESYLNNEMPTEEKTQFENRLKTDSEFNKSFTLYKETTQFLDTKFSKETIDFKQNLQSISKEYFAKKEQKEIKVIAFKPWYYAVAAILVIALGIFTFTKNDPQYGDYNQHENAYFIERNGYVDFTDVQNAFNAKDYKKAVASFEKLQGLNDPELQYFYAIALIETNDYTKAEALLNNIKSGTSVYKEKAIWYLALSNLKQKKFDDCKKYLKQIPADAEDYEKAQKLLKDLD